MQSMRASTRWFSVLIPVYLVFVGLTSALAAVPTVSSLSPKTAAVGGAGFTLTVNGTNFISGATIKWNGAPLTTKYVSGTQLTAPVASSLLTKAGAVPVTVATSGGTSAVSAASTFNIYPAPVIASLTPATAVAGGTAFTISINGSNFVSGATTAKWGSTPLTVAYKSATLLTAPITAAQIASPGPVNVAVTTPGGTSTATFTVIPKPPTVTGLSPNTAAVGSVGFTLTVNGTNFVSGATIKWNGTPLTTTYVSATQLTAPVSSSLLKTRAAVPVTVTTSGGVSTASAVSTFNVVYMMPTISSLSPATAVAGGAVFTLDINGNNFVSGATTAKWNTTPLAVTYQSETLLTASISATQITSAGTASISVTTPGGTSAAAVFTINHASTISSLSPASVLAGGAAFPLTINGAYFTSATTVSFAGTRLTVTSFSATKLIATVPATAIAKVGPVSVTVATGGVASTAVTFNVTQPAPTISSLNPASATAGGAAVQFTINGNYFLSGATAKWNSTLDLATTFVSTTQLTATVPAAQLAAAGTDSVTVTTSGGTSGPATFTVNKRVPTVSWTAPSAITYGTKLSGTQLDATASVSGTFVYLPAVGTELTAGSHQLSVTFTPADTALYATATASVTLVVNKATPVITWAPAAITYGTALSATQLDASATWAGVTVEGAYSYTPASGVLSAGAQTLRVSFTPTDTADYTSAAGSTTLTVNQAAASIAITPYSVTYDRNSHTAAGKATGVGNANLDADLTLSGTTHTIAGTYANDEWSFQDASGNYAAAHGTVTDTISKATATVTLGSLAQIYTGSALPATSTTNPAGLTVTYTYNGLTAVPTAAGNYTVVATVNDANYAGTATGTLVIGKATPSVTVIPYNVTYDGNPHTATGTAKGIGGASLNADLTLSGTKHTSAGTYATDSWSFQDASGNYANSSGTVIDTIGQATPVINWATPAAINYGTPLSAAQLNASASMSGISVSGTFAYSPDFGAVLPAGVQQLSVTFTPADLTDFVTASGTVNLTVNPGGTTVSGQINLSGCGSSGFSFPAVSVALSNSTGVVQTVTTDNYGNFSFLNVLDDTYTVTPSLSPAVASSAFYPATQSVVVAGGSAGSIGFQAELGYTVTGTVTYPGKQTGQIYVELINTNCGGSPLGTSISAPGAFTIRGVPPGTYTLQAWMDNLGYGARNASNPAGSTSMLTLPVQPSPGSSALGPLVALSDPSPVTLTSAPVIQGVSAFESGAIVSYQPITKNGVEQATSYVLQWSTDSAFQSASASQGSQTFAATGSGGAGIWLVNGLTDSKTYYFRVDGVAGSSTSNWSAISNAVPVGPPTGANLVSGTVSFTTPPTGPLYVGFYDQNTGNVYTTEIASPVSPQAYSLQVPNGSNYFFFGILDQNNDGIVDPGDVSNTNGNNNSSVAITGAMPGENLTLPSTNSRVNLTTQFSQQLNQDGTTNSNYNLSFDVRAQIKLPVAVSLVSGPNVLTPMDIGQCVNCGGSDPYNFQVGLNGAVPNIDDAYSLQIAYSDNTSDTLPVTVTNVLSTSPTPVSPIGSGASTTPNFTWTDPLGTNYTYQFQLWDNNGNQIWQVPSNNSKSNGLPSSITSIAWGIDPLNSSNLPTITSLNAGTSYNWQIQAQDASGNSAQEQVSFVTTGTAPAVSLPAPNPATLGTASVGVNYVGTVVASGGVAPYSWIVNSTPITSGGTPITLGNGLVAGGGGDAVLQINGVPSSATPVSFTVTVSDSTGASATQAYTITVSGASPASPVSGTVNYAGSQSGWIYVILTGNNCNGCNTPPTPGTAIQVTPATTYPLSFTIHGVPAGTYTLQAWMDTLGTGQPNAANPTGSTSNVTVNGGTLSGISVSLQDPVAVTPSSAPSIQGVSAIDQGAFVSYAAITNNGIEAATSYTLQWSTDQTFQTGVSSQSFAANGSNGANIWIVNGLTDGNAYYFQVQGVTASGAGPFSPVYGPVTIGAPPPANTVSGTVSFGGTATGPMYVGFYDQSTGNIYATVVGSTLSPPTTGATYSVQVPSGNNYFAFGIIDQNNDGMVDAGDITNVGIDEPIPTVITGPVSGAVLALPSGNSNVNLRTEHDRQVNSGGSTDNYGLVFREDAGVLLPVAVELTSGPNVTSPMDIGHCTNCGSDLFNFGFNLGPTTPNVGDTYSLLVTYSDGSSETLTPKVSTVLNAFASNLSPTTGNNNTSLTPAFNWSDPDNAGQYIYRFTLWDGNGNTVWQIPSQNAQSDGFSSNINSILWNQDPTNSNDLPNISSLANGVNYTWGIKTTDANGNGAQISVNYQVGASALTLPMPNPASLGSAVVNQYYSGSVTASGGVAPLTWTVNSTVVSSGNPVTLGNGLSVGLSGNNTLLISGIPQTAGYIQFPVTVTDSSSPNLSATQTYQINISSQGSPTGGGASFSGQISVTTCTGGSMPTIPVTLTNIDTGASTSTLTDNQGNGTFTFSNVSDGNYTITPSAAGVTGLEAAFYPASQPLTVLDGNVVGGSTYISFGASLGYTVTGSVSYSGKQNGQVYLTLTGNCGGGPIPGASISETALQAGGAFTIRGVPPGNYTAQAWMDNSNQWDNGFSTGAQNASNPAGTAFNVQVPSTGSSIQVTLTDPSPVMVNSAPSPDPVGGWGGFEGGAIVTFWPVVNSNDVEMATSYQVQWATDKAFSTNVGSKTFPATGQGNESMNVRGLTDGVPYYFRARGLTSTSQGPWSQASAPVTAGPATGSALSTLSGTINLAGTANGPLYVFAWDPMTGAEFGTVIDSPAHSQPYSFQLPAGNDYYLFAMVDQFNNGTLQWGDITDNFGVMPGPLAISGSATQNLTLPSPNGPGPYGAATVTTNFFQQSDERGSGGPGSYSLNFQVNGLSKMPVGVTLQSGPNVVAPADLGETCFGSCFDSTSFSVQMNGVTPNVGDTYSFQVTYIDGSIDTLTTSVSGVLTATATNLFPMGTNDGSNPTPTFSWTDPANASSYLYSFYLLDSGYSPIWRVPYYPSPTNGLTSSITSLNWGADPTDLNNKPTVTNLASGGTYYWQVIATDPNGNNSTMFVNYDPGFTSLALPSANPASLGPAVVNQSYTGTITATGGYAPYYYEVNGNGCFGCSPVYLNNGLTVTNAQGTLTVSGTPTSSGQIVLQVLVQDSTFSNPVSQQYVINVAEAAPVSLPTANPNSLGQALAGFSYSGAINASGGAGGGNYAWTVNGVPVKAAMPYAYALVSGGDGLTVATSGGNTLWFSGTPGATTSPISLTVTVTDTTNPGYTPSATYTVNVVSAPTGANNSALSGNYACLFQGFSDNDGSRWATLANFQADGGGNFKSGVFDTNGSDFTTEISGTISGSYTIGSDYNGLAKLIPTVTSGGTSPINSSQWAFAVTQSTTPAQEFRMVEIDDVGSTPSGMHGSGNCYLTSLTGASIDNSSFAMGMSGENSNSGGTTNPKVAVGRFSTVGVSPNGTITNGYIEMAKAGGSGVEPTSFLGTYTSPDQWGRSTFTLDVGGNSVTLVDYLVDSTRSFILETTSQDGVLAGNVRQQSQQTDYSGANLNGPFVLYSQGLEWGSSPTGSGIQGYYASVFQGTGDGQGNITVNQSYQDKSGTYSAGNSNGGPIALSFDPTYFGRATLQGGASTVYFYLFGNNQGFEMNQNSSGGLESGWLENQTATTFTNGKLVGNYMVGQMPQLSLNPDENLGEFSVLSTGAITGSITSGGEGSFSWDQSMSLNYTWDTTATGTGTFLVTAGSDGLLSCAVINPKKAVCTPQNDSAPSPMIMQE